MSSPIVANTSKVRSQIDPQLKAQHANTVLHRVPTPAIDVLRLEQGTLIEMENETELLKRFNQKRTPFKAWPIAPIPGLADSFKKSWLLLVKIPQASDDILFPSLTDRFTIDLKTTVHRHDGKYSLVHLSSTRIQNPYESVENLANPWAAKCAAFKVDVPRSWQNDNGDHIELDLMGALQTATALNDFGSINLDESEHQQIVITWDTFSLTYEAELAALRYFIEDKRIEGKGPSRKAQNAFKMILDFTNSWKTHYDLHSEFPHLKNPCLGQGIPRLLVEKFKSFNADHRAAYDGLANIPNGLYFVNGCPGAGKTEWNMVVAALIQARPRPPLRKGWKRQNSPILFVVDLNKTVDDAADRYFSLCKQAGLRLRIIRMHGFPYEIRNSSRLNKSGPGQGSNSSEGELDFTKKFLAAMNIAKSIQAPRNANKVPTLDEAAWDYYEEHKTDGFPTLTKILTRMDLGEALNAEDWRLLRSQVSMLYKAVIAQADFIATTPVAAYGNFSKLFRPVVVFIDEAPHARELTTLIPLAYFDPIAWIFTGDVKQTRPFVKSGNRRDAERDRLRFNPHAEQLRTSTMARAEAAGAINSRLLINKRAHGNLHALPSKMFYEGNMVSGYQATEQYPANVLHMKRHLELMGGVEDVRENRVVVELKGSQEKSERGSFWNPVHHQWLLKQVQSLLQDPGFRSTTNKGMPGKVMIQTPYSAAVRQYVAEVRTWLPSWQERVEILTVDKAQGNQADAVFLDMVRTTRAGFMNEPQRLNVAITRARQAEVILMHEGMTKRMHRGARVTAEFTSQIWQDAQHDGRLFRL